jgi:pimeloyl-ACP methyl ester carboxylesterase
MPRDAAPPGAVAHRVFAGGPARLLALHCGLGRGGLWQGLARALAPRATLVAPDLPGHGQSAALAPGQDVHDACTAAMQGFLEPGMHVIGHSFGATVALRLALEAPQPPASLTLIEPVLFAAARGHALHDSHRAQEAGVGAALAAGDAPLAAERFNALWGGGTPWQSLPERSRAMMAAGMGFVAGSEPALWQDRAGLMAPGRLEALACPVVLVRGAQTVPVIAAVQAGLLARLPRARERVIPGAGHMLPLTHAAALAALLPAPLAAEAPPSPATPPNAPPA